MAFSILSGLLGIATIVWYGLVDVGNRDQTSAREGSAASPTDVAASDTSTPATGKEQTAWASGG